MNVLVFSTLFPNCCQPNNSVFIKHRMAAVKRFYGVDVRVTAPIPFFPPLKQFPRWHIYSQIPQTEIIDNLEVSHPRYFVTPKIGMSLYGWWMFLGAWRTVKNLNKRFPIDLIDAHYIYPDGFAAILLGKALKIPVVVSARGTDINFFPRFPMIRPLIQFVLQRATHVISVCASLKEIMQDLGTPADKVTVIPNGIDPTAFYRVDRSSARQRLGIPNQARILLTVGQLIERKGIHILIDALHQLQQQDQLPFITYIIGGGEMRDVLADQIHRLGLNQQVKLQGEVKNIDLVNWYNAADVFFLGSNREGWPNVVSEALSCGVPVVSTPANGVPEIITSKQYGILVERNVASFAQGLKRAFATPWDHDQIYVYGQSRTWETVAGEVHRVFQQIINNK